jgi:hypothetical protein
MAFSPLAKSALYHALANYNAAVEVEAAIQGNSGGAPQDVSSTGSPTFAAATITGNETVGGTLGVTGTATLTGVSTASGNVNVASGKVYKVNGVQVVGAQAAAVAPIVTTYTSGSAPTTGVTQTIGNSASPNAVELLQYIANVEARVTALNLVIHNHGLTA